MGNVSPRPTNKLNMFVTEINDFSFNMTSNVAQIAQQNIIVDQVQNVFLSLGTIENCTINITQDAQVFASQTVAFRNMFTNPRDFINKVTKGPNSIIEQMLRSTSAVMQDFLEQARQVFNIPADNNTNVKAQLRGKFVNIVKTRIDRNSLQKATQNLFVSQEQTVKILSNFCKNSKIDISQSLLVTASQNAVFEVLENSVLNDTDMKRTLRQFNGDYAIGLLDSNMDAGASIPDACYNLEKKTNVPIPCPPCEGCIITEPQLNVVEVEKLVSKDLVFQAWFIYTSITIFILILLFLFYLKIKSKKN